MDSRVVVPLALGVVALLLVGFTAGAFDPLVTTDGYNPSTPDEQVSPTAGSATPAGSPTATPLAYEHANVTVRDAKTNETLGTLSVAIAETWREKYTGLSKTESLPENGGMLFPYDETGNRTYVMREMSFGIDIVYIGADGRITTIHHAPKPPDGADGEDYRYPGRGKYVLETNYHWTTEHNVTEGDKVVIEREKS